MIRRYAKRVPEKRNIEYTNSRRQSTFNKSCASIVSLFDKKLDSISWVAREARPPASAVYKMLSFMRHGGVPDLVAVTMTLEALSQDRLYIGGHTATRTACIIAASIIDTIWQTKP